MLLASVDWTNVLVALIAGAPGIIAAVLAGAVRNQVRTPSGPTIGEQVERSHLTAIANNLLLSTKNAQTKPGDPEELFSQGSEPPQVPGA